MKNYYPWFRVLASLAILLSAGFAGLTPVKAATSATQVVQVSSGEVSLGETLTVQVNIKDVTDLYAFDLRLTFDPALVQVVDAYPDQTGVQVSNGAFMPGVFQMKNSCDNTTGTIRVLFTFLQEVPGNSGNGTLIQFKLRGIKEGVSTIQVVSTLSTPDPEPILASDVAGEIRVVPHVPGADLKPVYLPLMITSES